MNSNNQNNILEALPEENRLVRRAKSGDASAFVHLYDAYADDVYRYIYFRVMNDTAAEGITSNVFRHAWEHLDSYQKENCSFLSWIYTIVRNQVIEYYRANIKTNVFNAGFLSVAADYGLNGDGQVSNNHEAWHNHLQLLTADKHQSLLQMNTILIMARYLDYLNPGRVVKPSPTFNAYSRAWLTRYLPFHTRIPKRSPTSWRISLSFIALIGALLVTGTAKAQSALPGELLYGWKRTSEEAWRSLSTDPVGTDIILADRRLNEWIALENDPTRSAIASTDYFDELAKLQSAVDEETRVRVIPVLKAHRQRLNNAGLSTSQFDNFLVLGVKPSPGSTTIQVYLTEVVPPATIISSEDASQATKAPIEVVVPATEVSTEIIPPATEIPTQVVPPATEVPTEVVPPATEVPTEAPPPTDEPTEIPQTIPTDPAP